MIHGTIQCLRRHVHDFNGTDMIKVSNTEESLTLVHPLKAANREAAVGDRVSFINVRLLDCFNEGQPLEALAQTHWIFIMGH